MNGVFKQLLGKHFASQVGEPKDIRRQRLLHAAGLCLNSALTILHIKTGFARSGLYPYIPEVALNSTLVRDPATQFIAERPAKKKRGVDISGKILTDGMVITPIILPVERPQPKIATVAAPKCKQKNTPSTTITTLVVAEK